MGFACCMLAVAGLASRELPSGLVAASVGDEVVLVDPFAGWSQAFTTGPVGWLFPAPGGIVFAPDLVNSRTTVLDLRRRAVREQFAGVSMPHFGSLPDRYVVVAGDVLLVGYPDRAQLGVVPAGIEHPWQVVVMPDDLSILVLEHSLEGQSGLVAVDLVSRQVSYRQQLEGEVARMAFSRELGLVALANRASRSVDLVNPAAGSFVGRFELDGVPADVAFAGRPELLVVALATANGGGQLCLWTLRTSARKGLQRTKERILDLASAPVRLASDPWGERLAVAHATGEVTVVDPRSQKVLATSSLPDEPRDLIWCDPDSSGPSLPEWSDGATTPSPLPGRRR